MTTRPGVTRQALAARLRRADEGLSRRPSLAFNVRLLRRVPGKSWACSHETSTFSGTKSCRALTLSFAVLCATIAAAGACAAASTPGAARATAARGVAEVAVTLRIGESASPQGFGVTITLLDVTDDSRCPADATCIWAGDATVNLRIERPDAAATVVELHTGLADRRTAAASGLRLTLSRLDPLPVAGQPVPREGYRAAIAISR